MQREEECNKGMREKIFINEIGNVKKTESMENVGNDNRNNRKSIVRGERHLKTRNGIH